MQNKPNQLALRTGLLYCVIAGGWILLSDRLLAVLFPNADAITHFQTYKGLAFVGVSAALLYVMLRGQLRRLNQETADRQQAQTAFEDSAERLRLAVSAAHVGLWDWDLRTNKVYFSPEWKHQIGYEDHEITNDFDEWQNRVHPDDLDRALQSIRTFIARPLPEYQSEFRLRHKDGSYRWILAQGSLLNDEQGKPNRMLGSHLDITGRKQADEELRRSFSTLEIFIDSVVAFVSFVDAQQRYQLVNRKYEDWFGMPKARIVGQRLRDVHRPQTYALMEPHIKLALAGQKVRYESEIVGRDGKDYCFDVQYIPRQAGDGTVLGFFVLVFDITERKKQDEELRLLGFSMDKASDAIFWINVDGGFSYVNDQACHSLGYTREELLKLRLWDIDPVYPKKQWDERWTQSRKDRQMRMEQLETVHRRKDGVVFHVEVTSKHMWFGDVELHVAFARDITERKRVEEALRASEERYRLLFEGMLDGFALHEIICDATGRPTDYRFLSVSPAFERMTGLRAAEVVGRTVLEIMPETEPMWIERYGRVALTGEGVQFEEFSGALKKHYKVVAFRPKPGQFAVVFEDITGRKRAEEALRESEERIRLALTAANQGLYDLNVQTGECIVSPEYARMLGYDPVEFHETNAAWIERLHPDDRELVAGIYRDYVAGRSEEYRVEFRQRTKGGDWKWILSLGKLVSRSADGQPLRMLGTHTDITTRKLAEEALREGERRYQTLAEVSPVGIFRTDAQGLTTYVNPRWCQISELSAADALGNGWLRAVHPLDREQLAQGWQEATQAPHSSTAEYRFLHPDGTVAWVMGQALPETDNAGRIVGYVGTITDVTERKLAEESHTRLATALEQAAEIIVIADTNGAISYVNPAFEKITGYTRQEVIGQNPRLLKSGKHDAAFYRQMWETLVHGEVWAGHIINKRKDGSLFEEEATISPIRDAAGKIVSYVAVKRDVTREVAMEAQLRQSQKMDAIGQLSGGVAHDFNNILGVIQGHISLMKLDGDLSPELMESAEEIQRATERAANLTRQLLMFSRRQAMQPRDLDLNEIVAHIIKMLQRILGEDIRMQLSYAPQPLLLRADAGMLDQILLNLAVNARDAMPNGGRLIIETSAVEFDEQAAAQSPQARPGPFACLSVTDTGCGIPREILPKIFDPFFTTKDVGKGTGLGLATVFGIVQQHQGWINLDSEVGRGTTFRVYLPCLARTSGQQSAPAPLPATRGGRETVLLVEDDPSLRFLVRNVLSRLGYQILEAPTGVIAQELWKEHRQNIRLVLTDLVMPDGMTGMNLAKRLLRDEPGLKIIFTSGYSPELAGKDFPLEEGVNFLAKPFHPRKLAETVRARLDA